MANHGYVYTKKSITDDELLKLLQEINDEFFAGILEIEVSEGYGDGKYFYIWNKKNFGDFGAVEVWLSDEREYGHYKDPEDDSSYVEYKEPKILGKNSVVEFRHGHRVDIFWWLEGVFRENIAKRLNGIVGDDGYSERSEPEPEKYDTFEEYLKCDSFSRNTWENITKNIPYEEISFEQRYLNFKRDILNEKRKKKLERLPE